MMFDLCIVGAGLFGSAAARHASANPTLKVVLVGPDEPNAEERKTRTVFSCHYDEGRITRVFDDDYVYQQLSKESISRYKELERLSGINFYNPVGFLTIAEENSKHHSSVSADAAVGKVSILHLSHEQTRERYPFLHLNQNEVSCLDENGAGFISARNMVKAQKRVAELQGCEIIHDIVAEVLPLSKEGSGLCHKILTEKGMKISAKRVLVCAGAFTKFKPLVPHKENWIVRSVVTEETAALLKISSETAQYLRRMPSIVYYGKETAEEELNSYILPPIKYPDGCYYIKIGHIDYCGVEMKTLEALQKWYNSEGNESIVRYADKLREMLPGLHDEGMVTITCACCYTPNGIPYIDRVTPTLAVAFGGNGKGAKISDEVGRIAAELSVYGKWDCKIPKNLFEVVWDK